MLLWKLSVREFPLDKELTADCLVETRTKLEELIPAAMVKYGLNRVQLSLWLQQSLINGFPWYGLSWAIRVSEHLQNVLRLCGITKSGGIVHLKSHFFFFFNFFFYAECVAPQFFNFNGPDAKMDVIVALLAMGLSPNVCYHKEKRKLLTTENKSALIHKSSVNFSKFDQSFPSPFFAFAEKVSIDLSSFYYKKKTWNFEKFSGKTPWILFS